MAAEMHDHSSEHYQPEYFMHGGDQTDHEAEGIAVEDPEDGIGDVDDNDLIEQADTQLEELASAVHADIASLAPGRGPYSIQSPIQGEETCIHLNEARALTDRSHDLTRLAIGSAEELTGIGEQLSEEFLARHIKNPWEGCGSVCEDERFALLKSVALDPANTAALQREAVAYGKERRPIPLRGEHDVLAQVIDAVSVDTYFTYSRVSGLSRDSMREHPGSCMQGAYLMQQRLREIGIETNMMRYTKPPFFAHFYLHMPTNSGSLCIDPTWQQFMPEGSNRDVQPRVLITPYEMVTEAAKLLGVRNEDTGVWSQGKPCSSGWWEYHSTQFNAIMKADGWYESATEMQPSLRTLLIRAQSDRGPA